MRTKFPFTLEIDEDNFALEYKEPNKKQSKELMDEFSKIKGSADEFFALKDEIGVLEEKKSAKKELATCLDGDDKSAVIKEILALIDEIEAKSKQLKEYEKRNINLDEVSLKRFEISIGGDDCEALKKAVEEKGISHYALMNAIDETIAKERVKK
ncbi:hypothetical protein [Campylobacter curvus]|uniref:hypothetical protein n=1 Tax=Campylobacter curvus TaxID=200 RepID=UPI00147058A1|nr:hypothetical protein [Campylobacter curvus]